MKFDTHSAVSPAFDCVPMGPLVILNLCWCCYWVEVIDLPVFQPNDYLFKNHADKGKKKWEIIAWAIREIISEAGSLQ